MSAHAHVHHSGDDLAVAAQSTLEASGEQWTALRARVFDVLSTYEKPASAYDIAEALSKSEGRRVAANTVYRILDLFVTSNLARKLESANAYVANDHPDCIHDCIFLVCDDCGRATHVDDDAIATRVRGAAEGAGFQAVRPVIEVRGRCEDCA